MSRTKRRAQHKTAPTHGRPGRNVQCPDHRRPPTGRLLLAGLSVAVVLAVAAAHWPALSAQALSFDDYQYMQTNPYVQQPGWASAGRLLSEVLEPSTVRGYYQPLAMISLMLDWAAGGRPDNLMPFHRTSLALHLANTILLIILLYTLFRQPVIAAAVGLLFGLHPLTVEPIPWVGERKTLLAALFSLCALILYVRYARSSRRSTYAGCTVTYILALLSKPTATPLPILFLLLDVWPLRRLDRKAGEPHSRRAVLLEKAPWLMIGALAAVVTVISQGRTGGVTTPTDYPSAFIPLTICHNIVFYLYKIVWPTGLSSHYAFPSPFSMAHPMMATGVVGTTILIPALLVSWRWSRAPLIGWLFFFVAIFPTMGVIGFTNVIASDKFVYLPAVGLLMVVAHFLTRLWAAPKNKPARLRLRVALVAVVAVSAGLEFHQTRHTLIPWRDTETLYGHMLAQTPDSPSLHHNLALFQIDQGKTDAAIEHLETALRLDPGSWKANNELGEVYRKRGETTRASEYFEAALRANPRYFAALNNLGLALLDQGRYDEAIARFDAALDSEPGYRSALINKGNALLSLNRYDDAVTQYRAALRLKPDHARTHYNLGLALQKSGRLGEAIAAFRQALHYQPDYPAARRNLDAALQQRGPVSTP